MEKYEQVEVFMCAEKTTKDQYITHYDMCIKPQIEQIRQKLHDGLIQQKAFYVNEFILKDTETQRDIFLTTKMVIPIRHTNKTPTFWEILKNIPDIPKHAKIYVFMRYIGCVGIGTYNHVSKICCAVGDQIGDRYVMWMNSYIPEHWTDEKVAPSENIFPIITTEEMKRRYDLLNIVRIENNTWSSSYPYKSGNVSQYNKAPIGEMNGSVLCNPDTESV